MQALNPIVEKFDEKWVNGTKIKASNL